MRECFEQCLATEILIFLNREKYSLQFQVHGCFYFFWMLYSFWDKWKRNVRKFPMLVVSEFDFWIIASIFCYLHFKSIQKLVIWFNSLQIWFNFDGIWWKILHNLKDVFKNLNIFMILNIRIVENSYSVRRLQSHWNLKVKNWFKLKYYTKE